MDKELEILELLDEIDIEESEFDSVTVDLMDIEKWNIKKKLRKKLFKGRMIKKLTMASSLCLLIISTGVFLSKPAFAEKIQVFESIYKALGYYNDYLDYSKYIGMSKEDKGYIVTIQDLMVTEKKMVFSVKVTSEKPFPKADKSNISFDAGINGVTSGTGSINSMNIDDKTKVMVVMAETKDSFPKRGVVHMIVRGTNVEDESDSFHVNYEFKVDFSNLFSQGKTIHIGKKVNIGDKDIEIKEIYSSPIETDLVVKNADLIKNQLVLVLDDKAYKSEHGYGNGDGDKDMVNMSFPVTSEDIENAKTIKIIPRNSIIDIVDWNIRGKVDKLTYDEVNKSRIFKEEDNVKYPSSYKCFDGVNVEIYKLEKDNDKLRIFIHSDKNAFQKALDTWVGGLRQGGYVYKDETGENSYIKEFNISGITGKLEVLPAGINPEYFDVQQPIEIYKK